MSGRPRFETINVNNVEICRSLCDELMAYQKSKAFLFPEAFDSMSFDTRMKKSCENAVDSQIIVCKDLTMGEEVVGYAFSTVEAISKESALLLPFWVPEPVSGLNGFYPDWLKLPQNIGCLNNIYIKDGYRNLGLGAEFIRMALSWFKKFSDIEYIFVYISNGNDDALKFYETNGFNLSHDVFGGFITAMFKLN